MSSAGTAAQLSFTKGRELRRELSWMARATSSLPVPFSPVTSTRPSEGAARRTRSKSFSIAGLEPSISARPAWARSSAFSSARWEIRSALRTAARSFSFSVMGFSR